MAPYFDFFCSLDHLRVPLVVVESLVVAPHSENGLNLAVKEWRCTSMGGRGRAVDLSNRTVRLDSFVCAKY